MQSKRPRLLRRVTLHISLQLFGDTYVGTNYLRKKLKKIVTQNAFDFRNFCYA